MFRVLYVFASFRFLLTYREDRRRGYIGNDYGEQDDEIDYSKKFDDEEPILLVSQINI